MDLRRKAEAEKKRLNKLNAKNTRACNTSYRRGVGEVGSSSYLLGVLKLPPETFIHSFGGFLRTAHHRLDVDLKATVQKLVNLPVIIVVIPAENNRAGRPRGEHKE